MERSSKVFGYRLIKMFFGHLLSAISDYPCKNFNTSLRRDWNVSCASHEI